MTTPLTSSFVVDDFGKRFGREWALRHCTFQLHAGTITALVGPNGAGKSTLMSAAAGLLGFDEGRIVAGGSAVTAARASVDIGYLAQDKPLYRRYRVRDLVDISRHLNFRWDQDKVDQLLDDAEISVATQVAALSGGQRTRLALALVLGRRPSVLLLDEPLAELDPLARRAVLQTLLTEVLESKTTVLMSSHVVGELPDVCDDLLLLQGGRIVLSGEIEALQDRHRVLIGPGTEPGGDDLDWITPGSRVETRRSPRQTTVLAAKPHTDLPAGWNEAGATIDEIVLAYLRRESPTSAHPAEGNINLERAR